MPELPEVETVRRGLEPLAGDSLIDVAVHHPRAVRHQEGGAAELVERLRGARLLGTGRRGKFLWLTIDRPWVLLIHLGMSGQLRVMDADGAGALRASGSQNPHLRVSAQLGSRELWFVDQRTFGYWWATDLRAIGHIAPDLLEADLWELAAKLKAKRLEIKRLLLNQEVVSGIGNIYADEMLWDAGVHPRQRADRLALRRIVRLLEAGRAVMERALAAGGTSFDALYVNVNGESGYFERSLNAYGRQGQACRRCGAEMQRVQWAGRSNHFCPRCQRRR